MPWSPSWGWPDMGTTTTGTLFGPVMQLGFVVPDLERAMEHWSGTIGVGPFFVLSHIQFAETFYKGRPTKFDMSVRTRKDTVPEPVEPLKSLYSIWSHWLQKPGNSGRVPNPPTPI